MIPQKSLWRVISLLEKIAASSLAIPSPPPLRLIFSKLVSEFMVGEAT